MVDRLTVRIEQFEYEMEEMQANLKKKAKPPPKLVQVRRAEGAGACSACDEGRLELGVVGALQVERHEPQPVRVSEQQRRRQRRQQPNRTGSAFLRGRQCCALLFVHKHYSSVHKHYSSLAKRIEKTGADCYMLLLLLHTHTAGGGGQRAQEARAGAGEGSALPGQ